MRRHRQTPRKDSARTISAGLLACIGVWLAAGVGGCSVSPHIRVVPAEPPAVSAGASLPSLPDDDARLPFVLSESARFARPGTVKFIAAREAFWDYDTDTAVKLLRELRRDEQIAPEFFHTLALQCYEQSGRWAETVQLYREFGLEDTRTESLKVARFLAALPSRQLEFAAETPAVPIEVKAGGWVVTEGAINGAKARLLLDTGAGISIVSARLARHCGIELTNQSISLGDGNGRARDRPFALVRELRLAGLTVHNTPVVVVSSLGLAVAGVDAIVGWEILQQTDLTWDFPAKRMTIAQPAGPIAAAPSLSGRVTPFVTVLSMAGRPLDLAFDSGAAANRRTAMKLMGNAGVLATKLRLEDFRSSWLPTVHGALHSVAASWPRRAQPFRFWMGGNLIEVPSAALEQQDLEHERLVRLDGVIGNAPFLNGRLHICGVKREFWYEGSTRGEAWHANGNTTDPSRRRRPLMLSHRSAGAFELAQVEGKRGWLGDAAWREARVGWGEPARNGFWVADGVVVPLMLQREEFARGLYAHAASRYVFALDGRWKSFAAIIGLRDGAHEQGSAIFSVRGDGRELYVSTALRVGARQEVLVDVSGIRRLELITEGGEGHTHNAWAIWADVRVER